MNVWLIIAGGALATYFTSATPFLVTMRRRAPEPLLRYLDALPIAIIAALVGPAVLAPGGRITTGSEPIAGLVALAITLWRRNLLLGMLGGIAAIALQRSIFTP